MIYDPGDLLREQARIDRVVDRTNAKDAIPGFNVAPGVPRKRCHPVTHLDAVLVQSLGNLQCAGAHFGIVGRVDWTLNRARNDLSPAMIFGGMVDDAMAQQRPFLHQAEHGIPLSLWALPLETFGRVRRYSGSGPAPCQSRLRLATASDGATVSL